MKVFIVTDMEGINGVVTNEQASVEGPRYQEARKWLTEHVNAAVKAAFEMGANEVVISDGHNNCRNILLDQLHPDAVVITGKASRPLGPMQGIDNSFSAVFMVGLHGKEGSMGVLDHTVHGIIDCLTINGHEVGEIELNAAIAGEFGVPVAMVSGDTTAEMQAKSILPQVETAPVMEGIGSYSARVISPQKACERVYEASKKALKRLDCMNIYKFESPIKMDIRFKSTAAADGASIMPGVIRKDTKMCSYEAQNVIEAQAALTVMIVMATNNK